MAYVFCASFNLCAILKRILFIFTRVSSLAPVNNFSPFGGGAAFSDEGVGFGVAAAGVGAGGGGDGAVDAGAGEGGGGVAAGASGDKLTLFTCV